MKTKVLITSIIHILQLIETRVLVKNKSKSTSVNFDSISTSSKISKL